MTLFIHNVLLGMRLFSEIEAPEPTRTASLRDSAG